MFRRPLPYTRRSMKNRSGDFYSHGATCSRWIYFVVFAFVCCITGPNVADATFTCPTNCTCTTFKVSSVKYQNISCTGIGLTSVPRDGKEGGDVVKLDLANNQIPSVNATDFQYFENLAELVLSNNPLSSIADDAFSNLTNLQNLNLAANHLTSLPSGIFTDTNITTLNLSSSANMDVTTQLAESQIITVLDLSHNNLTALSSNLFDSMQLLRDIFLDHNQISTIGSNTFQHPSITKIDLSANLLTEISIQLKKVESLLSLDLSYNLISSLSNQFLKHSGVQNLYLSNNQIAELNDKAFRSASTLVTVDLSNNLITDVDEDAFDDLERLNDLDLSFNSLTSLDSGVFSGTTELQKLDLSQNSLQSLRADIFSPLPNLDEIYLNNNGLTTLSSTQFVSQGDFSVDMSYNNFVCSCLVRDYLFSLYYIQGKTILNEDLVKCTDTTEHIFLDWDDAQCTGNLGSACNATIECHARNAECNSNLCKCMNNYYDNNEGTAGGECKAKVRLNYPCDLDTACLTANSSCSSGSCKCLNNFYDTDPVFLGGDCKAKLELGGGCTLNDMCLTTNAFCNTTSGKCECTSSYYDSNNSTRNGGTCILKIALNNACNASYQCAPDNSECRSTICSCLTGYYDFDNSGTCKDPSAIFSCFPLSTSDTEIHFLNSSEQSTEIACAEFCFKANAWYYLIDNGICFCGNKSLTTTSCCPKVLNSCNSRIYHGPVSRVTAGIRVTMDKFINFLEGSFNLTTNLSVIDSVTLNLGDGRTASKNAAALSVRHTYTAATIFNVSAIACNKESSVCDQIDFPMIVGVLPSTQSLWITSVPVANFSNSLTKDIYVTFTQGYNLKYFWERNCTNNSVVTTSKKQGCENSWIPHREKCIKLFSTPLNYTNASYECSKNGALLWEPDFARELQEIYEAGLVDTTSTFNVRTGLLNEGGIVQKSSSGSKPHFSVGDLEDDSAGSCVDIVPSSLSLTSTACTTASAYVCMKDPGNCSKGGSLQSDGYCLVLSENPMTWEQANDFCSSQYEGNLGSIQSASRQAEVAILLNSAGISEAFIGVSDSIAKGNYFWTDGINFNNETDFSPPNTTLETGCVVTAASTWKTIDCDQAKPFICEYSENTQSVSVIPKGLGNNNMNITGNVTQTALVELTTNSATNTDIIIFPGLLFPERGKLQYFIIQTNLSSTSATGAEISLLIFRPVCNPPLILVQPGCFGNRYPSCSSSGGSCANTTCLSNQNTCFLSNTCKFINQSCSCVSESNSGCSSDGTMPHYSVVSKMQTRLDKNGTFFVIADSSFDQYDILGFQYNTNNKDVIKCENESTNENQQKGYKAAGVNKWYDINDGFPSGSIPVELTCFIQIIYLTEDVKKNLPDSIAYPSEPGSCNYSVTVVETNDTKKLGVRIEDSITDVSMIYPPQSSQISWLIQAAYNESFYITIRLARGTNVYSEYRGKTFNFTLTCIPEVSSAVGQECNASLFWTLPFSTFSDTMTETGNQTFSISIINPLHTVKKNLTIETAVRVYNVTVLLLNATYYTNNTIKIDEEIKLITTVVNGTSPIYAYLVNGTVVSSSTNPNLTHQFSTVGTHLVQVNASNIISYNVSNYIVIDVKQPALLSNCQHDNQPYVAAATIPLELKVQCSCKVGADVRIKWYFSSGASNITSVYSQTTSPHTIWSQSVTFVSAISSVRLITILEDPFQNVTIETFLVVYNPLPLPSLSMSSDAVLNGTNVTVSPILPSSPGNYGPVSITLQPGDGTTISIALNSNLTFGYDFPGNKTVTLTVSNGPSSVTVVKYVTVYTTITSCSLNHSGTQVKNEMVKFIATQTKGNFVSYNFNSSAFNATQSSNIFNFSFPTHGDYQVSVNCSNALSYATDSLIVIILEITEIRLTSIENNSTTSCMESFIIYRFTVIYEHYDATNITFDWDFGDNTPVLTGRNATVDKAMNAGNFTLTVTAKYAAQNAQQSKSQVVCVQEKISNITINVAKIIGLLESMNLTVNASAKSGSQMIYTWLTNATQLGPATDAFLGLNVMAEGFYQITVTISNAISTVTASKIFQVIEVISDLRISCSLCVSQAGAIHVEKDKAYVFIVSMATGSNVNVEIDWGDNSSSTGTTNSHTYGVIGTYNVIVNASNKVNSSVIATVSIIVETQISSVTIQNWLSSWTDNANSSSDLKNLHKTDLAVFRVTVIPATFFNCIWSFITGAPQVLSSNITMESYFQTTGLKTVNVTAFNNFNSSMNATFQFYVIEVIKTLDIQVEQSSNFVSKLNSTYPLAVNVTVTVKVTSAQIVQDTVVYLIRVRQSTGSIFDSSASATMSLKLPDYAIYTIEFIVKNSISQESTECTVEGLMPVAGVYIVTATGNANITLSSSLVLTAVVSVERFLEYTWTYLSAPSGEYIPTQNNKSATITPGKVGTYVVMVQVSNPVSGPVGANFTVNVLVAVSGVSISANLKYQNAVEMGTTVSFTAAVVAGTEVSYRWTSYRNGDVDGQGTGSTYGVTFSVQALYNITLFVSNNASSVQGFKLVYSLNKVSTIILSVTGAIYHQILNAYFAKTGDTVSIDSNITNEDYISFVWQQNGSTKATSKAFNYTSNSPASNIVRLTASNIISSSSAEIELRIQTTITGVSVSNCSGTFLKGTSVYMTVTYLTGTDATVVWTGRGLSSSTGSTVIVHVTTTGTFNITATISNYVSSFTQLCTMVVQGEINNLQLTVSTYQFVGYPITFTVFGNNLNNSQYKMVANGITTSTNESTINRTFTQAGTYTVTVIVSNAVSSSNVSVTVTVIALQCPEPVLTADGPSERETLKARRIVLSVSVNTYNCNNYSLNSTWFMYQASSGAGPLTPYGLPNSIYKTSLTLYIPGGTLSYGTYFIIFRSGYQSTPVFKSIYFNVTINPSDLVAVLPSKSVQGNLNLTIDASSSGDPDQTATLSFSWSCLGAMPSNNRTMAVCGSIAAVQLSAATLLNLDLISGDVYYIQVTVSAVGRISGIAKTEVTIASEPIPVISITCTSCVANNVFCNSNTKSTAFESICVSGCTNSTTYLWTIEDSSGNTLDVDTALTTTGSNRSNFGLRSGVLATNTDYIFKLSATDSGKNGNSQYLIKACTAPSATCSVSSPALIVPLQDVVNVSCQGLTDSDLMTAFYIKIVVASISSTDEYIVYYGTKTVIQVFISPFGGTTLENVQVKVYVENDYGISTFTTSVTVSFKNPSLTSIQATYLDFIITQIKTDMRVIANKNSPILLVQYAIAVLHFLNEQSSNPTSALSGTLEIRTAIRELISTTLSGIDLSTLQLKQQMASALKYLAAVQEELSYKTLAILVDEIDRQAEAMKDLATKGNNGNDFEPVNLLTAITTTQGALESTLPESNSTTMAGFGSLDLYTLDISSTYNPLSTTNLETWKKDMVRKTLTSSIDLVLSRLKTTVPGGNKVIFFINGNVYIAYHSHDDQLRKISGSGILIDHGTDIITNNTSSNYDSSIFQIASISSVDPSALGNSSIATVGTKTIQYGIYNGRAHVKVENLPPAKSIKMYIFAKNTTLYNISSSGVTKATHYDPKAGAIYNQTRVLGGVTKTATVDMQSEMATAIQFIVNFTSLHGILEVGLYVNSRLLETKNITQALMQNQVDHRNYTFFINESLIADSPAISFQMNSNVTLNVNFSVNHYVCQYFNTTSNTWERNGCTPTDLSIPTVLHCQCNHTTSFGGSLLVSPYEINFTDLTSVDIISNPVAIITCSVVLFVYIVAVVACRRMDRIDMKRMSNIPLCGKDGSFKYEVTVVTGRQPRAGTSAHVGIRLVGEYGKTGRQHISKEGAFKRNCSDTFLIAYDVNLGDLRKILVWHDNSGLSPSWYLSHVIVHDLQTYQKYYFICQSWLSLEQENGSIQREIKVAGEQDMNKFGYRMKTAMFNALADKHLWLSLFNRPALSRFTRVQRATCCVTLLFTFIGVNAMWYGLLKKDNTDLSWGTFGWEEIVLAIVTNVMIFPINIGIVFLFKKSRPKSNMLEHLQKPQTAQTIEIENLCDNSQGGSFESRNIGEVPFDIERESTIDSVPQAATALHRSRHVRKSHRENTEDSLVTHPRVAVTATSAKSPLWNQDNIMKWPDAMDYDELDSRPSTSSTIRSSVKQQATKTNGPAKGKSTKSKGATQQLLDELNDMENELKETESKSVRSSGSKRSVISSRKASMQKSSNWGSLEDIMNSDDESVADSGKRMTRGSKQGSVVTTSAGKKFNPRADPRINGNGAHWPKSRESISSNAEHGESFEQGTSGGITAGLRPGYYSEMTMESRDIRTPSVPKEKCSLPPWCIYVAYVLCFLLSTFSIIIVILYCFKFGTDESTEWVLAFIISLILSVFVIEPLKALLIAVYVVAMFKSVEQEDDEDNINIEPTFDNSNEKLKDVKFKPVSGFALLQAKEEGRKIHRMNVMLRQFIAYMFYLWILMVICYINFNQDTYLLNKYVNNTFVETATSNYVSYNNISSIEEFWDWSENVLADSLHLQDTSTDEEHGFLLGPARWRLIRSLIDKCQAANAAAGLGASSLTDRTCYGDGGFDEDTALYGERWNDSSYNRSWRYYSASQLGGSHKIGYVDTYGGGGYTQDLGTTSAETLTIIQDLKYKGFIDLKTRAVVIEFAMYSAGTDMTAMVAMLVEFPLSGGVLTSYEIQSQRLLWFQENRVDPLMVMECILFLLVIYSLVHITQQIQDKKKEFFKDIWNWYEILTTLMTTVSIGIYIGCVVEATNTFNNYLDNPMGFTNFERVAYVHVGMRYLHAWLLFLLMYKVVKQLRFIKFMYVYEKTLSTALGYLLATGLIYSILLMVYAQLGYLMYGRFVAGFETFWLSLSTLIVMIRGTFDFWPMLDYHPVFSHFYVYSYYTFTYGIMIALVIAILNSTYKVVKSQMYWKASLEMQDYEMIDFMLKRFKLWAGITKPKPAFRQVRFPGLPSVSSRSSSSLSNRTTSSLQSSQSVTGPEFSQVQLNSMLTRLAPTWQAVLKRFDKIEALDKEEENLVKKAEDTMKDLNLRCRINEFERQHKEILNWKETSPSSLSQGETSSKHRQSIVKRPPNRDNQTERKAPATVTGVSSRTAVTPPGKTDKAEQERRPLSDQGARAEPKTQQRSSTREKMHKFLQSVKPSKSAWNK